MSTAKNAILKAKINGVLTEVMAKTNAANVYVDDSTTLATKLANIVADIATKVSTDDLTTSLATKANVSHTHEQSEINGLAAVLDTLASTESVSSAIEDLRQEMLGDTPVEAYNTFTELAAYISEHKEISDALSAAIAAKADKTTVDTIQTTINGLGALATLDKVSEDNLSDELKEKVNAASEGNHSHLNKTVLDGITAEQVTNWDDAATKAHTHANATVLEGITSTKVAAWDAAEQNAKTHADDLNTAMDTRVKAVEGSSHTHTNKAVLDGITAEQVAAWDGKAMVYAADATVDLDESVLYVQLVD